MRIRSVKIETRNMNARQKANAVKAADMALDFFSSDFFESKMKSRPYWGNLQGESKKSITKDISSSELYDIFMGGAEEWNKVVDYEIDLIVSRYRKIWSRVKGYMIPMKPTIFVNAKYFDASTPVEATSNMCHEYSHTLGCRHSGEWFRRSLPYLINDWVEEYFNLSIVPVEIKTEEVCKRVWWKLWLGFECHTAVSR